MPKGIYKRTAYHLSFMSDPIRRKRHSDLMKGNKHLLGHAHTKETKLKMSLSHKGKKKSSEWRRKIGLGNLGRKQSDECKRKIGLAQRGKPQPAWFRKFISEVNKGHVAWNKGITHTPEARLKISLAHRGDKSRFWKGGKSLEPYPAGWGDYLKELIRNRDKRQCQLCGAPEIEFSSKLAVHHIDYNKKNIEIKNLISLCRRCHTKTNVNREYYIQQLGNILEGKYAKI